MRHYSDMDDALSALVIEGKNLSGIFNLVQTWADGEEDLIKKYVENDREDIEECLDNINRALEILGL